MNRRELQHRRWLAGLLAAAGLPVVASALPVEEPQLIKFNGAPEVSTGLEVEASREESRVSGVNSTYDHTFVAPVMGIASQGSLYHPNLLTFSEDATLGWNINSTKTKSPGDNDSHNDSSLFTRYLARINLLEAKPYNASFFSAQDHTYRDYGSFGTYTVDSWRYGGNMQYNSMAWSLNTDFGRRTEDTTGLTDNSQNDECYLNFMGINRRQSGQTTLNYRINSVDTQQDSAPTQSSVNQGAAISDSETFGHRKQFTSTSGMGWGQSEYGGQTMDTVNASEYFTANLRPDLDHYANLNYDHNEVDPMTSDNVIGSTGLRHQLYESLTSNLDAHGSYQNNDSNPGSYTMDRYGLGLYENYNKKLRSWGRLSAGLGGNLDHQDQNSSDGLITSFNEPHQLYLTTSPNYQPTYLNNPGVDTSTIQVNAGADQLILNTDYVVLPAGQLTQIQLVVPPSAHLQTLLQGNDNLAVTVTYQSESKADASFEMYGTSAQIRLDMFGNYGIYGRANWVGNNAPTDALAESLTDLVAGADYHWQWFRTGAEYENYDSNFTEYQAWRLFQNFCFHPSNRSTFNVDINQTFYTYAGGTYQDVYQLLTRYHVQILSALAWYVEGGASYQENTGSEQVYGSARTGVSWSYGKLSVRSGYEYNAQNVTAGGSTQEWDKHRVFFYLKRVF